MCRRRYRRLSRFLILVDRRVRKLLLSQPNQNVTVAFLRVTPAAQRVAVQLPQVVVEIHADVPFVVADILKTVGSVEGVLPLRRGELAALATDVQRKRSLTDVDDVHFFAAPQRVQAGAGVRVTRGRAAFFAHDFLHPGCFQNLTMMLTPGMTSTISTFNRPP